MRLRVLREEEIKDYRELDPFDMLERAALPGYYCVGVFASDGRPKAAGLMLYQKTEEDMILEWMYVDQGKRGCGLGEALLEGAYRIALAEEKDTLKAALTDYWERDRVCSVHEGYIRDRYFEEELPLSGEWHGRLSAFAKSHRIRKYETSDQTMGEIRMLSSFTAKERHRILEDLAKDPRGLLRQPVVKSEKAVERNISVCTMKGEKLTGAAIFEKAGTGIYLSGFLARTREHAMVLLVRGLSAAAEAYPDAMFHMILKKNIFEEAMEELFGKPWNGRLLCAETEMYLADQAYSGDVPDFLDALIDSMEVQEETIIEKEKERDLISSPNEKKDTAEKMKLRSAEKEKM